jgi:hypothetical protein
VVAVALMITKVLLLLYSINEGLFVCPKHLDQADFVSSVHEFGIFIGPRAHQDGPELVEWKSRLQREREHYRERERRRQVAAAAG